MAQTLIDITFIKDRQVALAIDGTAQILSNANFVADGSKTSDVVGVAGRKVTTSTASGAVTYAVSGTDSNIDLQLQPLGTGVIALAGTTTANASVQVPTVTSSVNFVKLSGAIATASPQLLATGTDTNVGLLVNVKGTGAIFLGGTTAANASVQVATVASAINQFVATPAATGNPAILSVGGSGADANAALLINALATGTGSVYLGGGGTLTNASVEVAKVSSSVNTVKLIPAATGTAPQVTVSGAGGDANRNLSLSGIGTGAAAIKGGTGAVAAAAGFVGETLGDKVFGTATTATITLTQANPGVITWTTHGFSTTVAQPVVFTTSSALPTNIVAGTVYYTVPSSVTASTFQIATSVANAIAGTSIDTTAGSNTGTQTGTAGTKMANTTAIDVCGMALTAGDWDVWAEIVWNANAATTWTTLEGSISQTSATLATAGAVRGTTYASLNQISAAATNGVTSLELNPTTINVSSATNVFLVVKGAFATNIIGAYGFIMARRRA